MVTIISDISINQLVLNKKSLKINQVLKNNLKMNQDCLIQNNVYNNNRVECNSEFDEKGYNF